MVPPNIYGQFNPNAQLDGSQVIDRRTGPFMYQNPPTLPYWLNYMHTIGNWQPPPNYEPMQPIPNNYQPMPPLPDDYYKTLLEQMYVLGLPLM